MTTPKLLAAALLALVLCSCSHPREQYSFKFAPGKEVYDFELMMDSPEAFYETSIACRYNAAHIRDTVIPVTITVTAPDGRTAEDFIDLPLERREGVTVRRADGSRTDIRWPWRRHIQVADTGLWKVSVRLDAPSQRRHVQGMGVALTREN